MPSLPIADYEEHYEVSECGQIRSLDRVIVGKDGVNYPKKGRLLKPNPHKDMGY